MMSRHEVAVELGRRVSRGEYERIFSGLHRVPLKTTKTVYRLNADGKQERVVYHPVMVVMNDHSPKFARKHGDVTGTKSRRARTEYAFAAK